MSIFLTWGRGGLMALVVAWGLAACGGGGVGSGGTGAPVSSSGAVSGFGSVWVDGLELDDANARVRLDSVEGAPDIPAGQVRLGLGQRVELEFEIDGAGRRVVSEIRISPQVIGSVTSVAPLEVAGQRVRVNTDAAQGPLTLLVGVADASALRVGQRVEVHGLARMSGGVREIVASRIATVDRPGQSPWLRLGGVVEGLTPEGFNIGNLRVQRDGRTVIVPRAQALAEGQSVRVWTRGGILGPPGDPYVEADRIQILRRQWLPQQSVRLSGPVQACTDAQRPPLVYVCIADAVIERASAQVNGGSLDDLVEGRYVDVQARYDAVLQVLRDARLELRTADSEASIARLTGEVSGLSGSRFTVRDTVVELDASTQRGCEPANGVRVRVTGRIAGDHVRATRIECVAP
ncbi:DUF5666 domain-containing protein [Caldimonas sp.]|uniref:DUF5666 domain-containing protein n=1 Tax=Caldimonas sp. TaxID=2838790 RepID=UPI00391C0A74